jgi:hypothetical protein
VIIDKWRSPIPAVCGFSANSDRLGLGLSMNVIAYPCGLGIFRECWRLREEHSQVKKKGKSKK